MSSRPRPVQSSLAEVASAKQTAGFSNMQGGGIWGSTACWLTIVDVFCW